MIRKHFDIVVLGRSIGALATAALLARRDFTVLVLGHGGKAPGYRVAEHEVRRRPFTFLAATSPAWARIVSELAQSQTWRRRTIPLDPMLQVVSGTSDLRRTALLHQPAHFIQARGVEKVRRMCGNQDLPTSGRVQAELLRELCHQRGVKLILRFFNTK